MVEIEKSKEFLRSQGEIQLIELTSDQLEELHNQALDLYTDTEHLIFRIAKEIERREKPITWD